MIGPTGEELQASQGVALTPATREPSTFQIHGMSQPSTLGKQ
jgi:hypothetical protein